MAGGKAAPEISRSKRYITSEYLLLGSIRIYLVFPFLSFQIAKWQKRSRSVQVDISNHQSRLVQEVIVHSLCTATKNVYHGDNYVVRPSISMELGRYSENMHRK